MFLYIILLLIVPTYLYKQSTLTHFYLFIQKILNKGLFYEIILFLFTAIYL